MKRLRRALIAIFILALVLLYIWLFAIPGLRSALVKTSVLEYGSLTIKDYVEAWVVRDETVFLSDRDGIIQYYVGEGEMVRKGTKILDVVAAVVPFPLTSDESSGDLPPEDPQNGTGDGVSADAGEIHGNPAFIGLAEKLNERAHTLAVNSAESGGEIGYHMDGYESVFSPENLSALTLWQAESAAGEVINIVRNEGDYVLKGEPMYKIINGAKWHLVFWIDKNIIFHHWKRYMIKFSFLYGR
jgi:hypothetical protein